GEIVESIARIPDSIKASVFVAEASRMLQIDERALLAELNKLRLRQMRQQEKQRQAGQRGRQAQEPYLAEGLPEAEQAIEAPEAGVIQPEELSDNDDAQEKEIIRLMLNYGTQALNEGLDINQFLIYNLEDVEF